MSSCKVWPDGGLKSNRTFITINVYIHIKSLTSYVEHVRGFIKKFVDWCDEINTYEAILTNFVGNIKQQMFYQLWKFNLDTLIINHFIIENNLYGMVTRRSLRWVPWRSTTSLFFNVTLYTLIHFWLGTQKSNTNLNNFFSWISNFTDCWVKLAMFYKKGEFNLNMEA